MAKIVGRAVALARGYYPDDGQHCRIIEEGETFNLVEGLTKGLWFKVLEDEPAPKAAAKKAAKQASEPAPPSAEDVA